ncbi:HNH endonuclease signature motif containing protein [Curtobacterium sp. USHLN213]|uniref:HNH endonuclease signature motif containing protein n=1 Tax=Curtobacterium sp. USHLN213 TaxID=3081255 RepID=UPI003019DA76
MTDIQKARDVRFGPRPRSVLDRLATKISVTSDGHVLWTAYCDKKGYGRFTVGKTGAMAHRVVYAEVVGDIPEGMEVDHICFVRNCVNPWHLRLVTGDQNKQSRARVDGRSTSGYPGAHWDKRKAAWRAEGSQSGRNKFLGYFDTRWEAYVAWREWARLHMPYVNPELLEMKP